MLAIKNIRFNLWWLSQRMHLSGKFGLKNPPQKLLGSNGVGKEQ
jgi:hypothetical protein